MYEVKYHGMMVKGFVFPGRNVSAGFESGIKGQDWFRDIGFLAIGKLSCS